MSTKRRTLTAGLLLGLAVALIMIANGSRHGRQVSAAGNGALADSRSQAGQASGPLENAIADGGFELGDAGPWTQSSSIPGPPIIVSAGFLAAEGVMPHSGDYAAWLGAAAGDTSYVSQSVTIELSRPLLAFWNWLKPAADSCSGNTGSVLIDDSPVISFSLCAPTDGWVRRTVNLSGFAGRSVRLQFRALTSDPPASLVLDDVSLSAVPAEPTQTTTPTPSPTPTATPTPTVTPGRSTRIYLPIAVRER